MAKNYLLTKTNINASTEAIPLFVKASGQFSTIKVGNLVKITSKYAIH